MDNIEILSLIVTIVCLLSFCLVFTFLFRHYYISNIDEIKSGRADVEIIDYNKEEKLKANAKSQKTKKIVKKVVGYTFLGIVVLFFGASLYSRFFNNSLLFGNNGYVVISSGSMSQRNVVNDYLDTYNLNNQFNTYDIIGITRYNSQADVELYDVVAFYGQDDVIYVHRIRQINSDGTYVTRGDSNNLDDTNRVYEGNLHYEDIIGYYNDQRIELVGIFIVFLQSNSGIITIISVVYCMLMFDHFKGKYDEALEERIEYIDKIVQYNYDSEKEVDEEVYLKDYEHLYYLDKEFLFKNGEFVSNRTLTSEELAIVKVEAEKFKLEQEKEYEESTFKSRLKRMFKEKKEDKEAEKEESSTITKEETKELNPYVSLVDEVKVNKEELKANIDQVEEETKEEPTTISDQGGLESSQNEKTEVSDAVNSDSSGVKIIAFFDEESEKHSLRSSGASRTPLEPSNIINKEEKKKKPSLKDKLKSILSSDVDDDSD